MKGSVKILGIAGSLRRGSYNRAVLAAAAKMAPASMRLETFEDLGKIPPFNQDDENDPPRVVMELKQRIRDADGILLVTPEYNYSVPGVLKNAIDWASRPYGDNAWEGKPVAVMGASIGMTGSARAQYHLRQMFVFLNMHALNRPEVMIPHTQDKFDAQGNLTDENTREKIRELLDALAAWTVRVKQSQKVVMA